MEVSAQDVCLVFFFSFEGCLKAIGAIMADLIKQATKNGGLRRKRGFRGGR